jgi:small multidrug resistance pump
MTRAYLLLAVAIAAEVVATSALKATDGFRRPGPSALVIAGYATSFGCLSACLRAGLGVGVAYAIWSGVGIVLIAAIGVVVYRERIDAAAVVGFALILAGVVVLNVFSGAVAHDRGGAATAERPGAGSARGARP